MKAEEILDKQYEPKMHWKSVNRINAIEAMKEYAIQKCREQRKLIEHSVLHGETKTLTDINLSIIKAPYPEFD